MTEYSIPLHPVNPWVEEPELLGFGGHNKNHVWNAMSPEIEFCQYVQDQLAQLTTESGPLLVLESGVGQGFVTRRILEVLRPEDVFLGHDTDPFFLKMIPENIYHASTNVRFVSTSEGIDEPIMALADFVVLDSDTDVRPAELERWIKEGRPGSHLIIHDTPEYRNGPAGLSQIIVQSGIEGHYTDNLRGGWHGVHP